MAMKPCAENLFMSLLQRYGEGEQFSLSAALIQLLTQAIKGAVSANLAGKQL